MDVQNIINIAEGVLFIILAMGGVIYGTIKIIQEKSINVKGETIDHMDKIKLQQETEMNAIRDRLDDLDRWRKDMNGQLKLINERQQFTNQILGEQKNQLVMVSGSLNSVATSLAVMGEAVKNLKSDIEKSK